MAPRPMRRAALARHNDSMDIDPELAGDTSLTLDGTAMAREDSSDMDEGSGDDYADPRAGPSNSQQAEEAPGEDDAVFQRLAGFVSSGAQAEGVVGASFQQELAAIDEEELPWSTAKKPRRRLRTHRPTYEVQQLLGRANMAYISQDHAEAINLFLEVIRHDNQVQAAWTTLASVYEEMGETVMARQMKFCSAHIEEDAGTWMELASEFKAEDNMTQALYCFRKALKVDPSRVDILWQLVQIYRANGQSKKAVDAIRKLHRAEPVFLRDFNLLMELHPLFHETHNWTLGATIFGDAFVFNYASFDGPDHQRHDVEEKNSMELQHIVAYVDYLLRSGDASAAINVIHRGQRWLQGRKAERGWDDVDDDSEFYPPREDDDGEEIPGGADLDIQLRQKLAVARLRTGDHDEAMIHMQVVFQLDVILHADMFKEIGDTLMKRQLWELALECWATLHERSDTDEPDVIYRLGVCQHQLKRMPEALESLKWVAEADPLNTQARLELASVLEDMGKKTEALEIVSELIRTGGVPKEGLSKGELSANRRLNKHMLEAQASATMSSLWGDVQLAEEGINNGEPWALDKFIHAAGTMIETLRLAKSNFTKNRGIIRIPKRRKYMAKNDLASQAIAMQDRLERTLGLEDDTPLDQGGKVDYEIKRQTQFYGVGAENWLELTIKYCCVLMVKNEDEVAMDILEHVVWAGIFNNRRCEVALRLTIVACAIKMRSAERIVDNCKRLAQMHQFRPEPMLLMLAALGGGERPLGAWQHVALQKFLHREVRIYDEAVTGVKLRFNARHVRWTQVLQPGHSRRFAPIVEDAEVETPIREDDDDEADEDEDGSVANDPPAEELEVPKPTKFSPVFNTLYGQNMLTAKSYQSALFYFFRAYEVNPYDPFLCFLIAQAFFGRALNRQSDNRNFQIAQGLAFLTRYRKLSPQDAQTLEEVEYNYGRAYHGLGILHLAVIHYERVLASVKQRMTQVEPEESKLVRQSSLAWETAHNLVLIYSSSGSLDLVRSISEAWLALED